MWVILGILLGAMVVAALLGFHVGPHSHAVAGGIGGAAAIWMLVMAFTGNTAPVLWVLLAADLVISASIGYLAWRGLLSAAEPSSMPGPGQLPDHAVARVVKDLEPEGIVTLGGEQWTAVSLNGTARAGEQVHVMRRQGMRLEVWREEGTSEADDLALPEPAPPDLFLLRKEPEPAPLVEHETPDPPDTPSAGAATD